MLENLANAPAVRLRMLVELRQVQGAARLQQFARVY
jgi:hypothetical protein